jgi:ABC-type enterochelin transport system substrate-binding protein
MLKRMWQRLCSIFTKQDEERSDLKRWRKSVEEAREICRGKGEGACNIASSIHRGLSKNR